MKTLIAVTLVLIVALLGGIFWIQWEQREQRIADQVAKQKEEDARQTQERAELQAQLDRINQQNREARIIQLREICDGFVAQSNLLRERDYYAPGVTTAMARGIWTNYYASYTEAQRLLAASNIDLSAPIPSTEYLDRERELGLNP